MNPPNEPTAGRTARFLLRPAQPDDLEDLERFAEASAHGITTLPPDRAALVERLRRSAQAFATDDDASGEEIYLFVLEDTARRRLVGTSGIAASAGFASRYYAYRNEFVVHVSPALAASSRIHTLHLCHDLTGVTLLTSFYIEPEYERSAAAHLLSRARLLFIAEFAERFSDRIAAESPGLADDHGRCPFWDAVGRRFFDMDYPAVERLSVGRSRSFIGDLMPRFPVYVPLLPEEAQWAIGQLHPVAEAPFAILLDEGFDVDTYVDIFDGGPIVQARVAMLKSVAGSRSLPVERIAADGEVSHDGAERGWSIAANVDRRAFRATLLPAIESRGPLALDAPAAALLGVRPGGRLRVVGLDTDRGEMP